MIKINMPKLRKTICKRTLPYFTFNGWVREPQSIATLVQISTRSTDQYCPVEYPNTLATRGLEEPCASFPDFAIIISFMLFTVFPLIYVLYFKEFLIHDSCGFMIMKNN